MRFLLVLIVVLVVGCGPSTRVYERVVHVDKNTPEDQVGEKTKQGGEKCLICYQIEDENDPLNEMKKDDFCIKCIEGSKLDENEDIEDID